MIITFLDVLLLFNNKHVVVEELLQLLVDKVDTDLLKGVELEDLKTGDIQDTNKVNLLHGGVDESGVAHVHDVSEETAVDVFDDGASTDGNGNEILSLVDPLHANLELGIDEAVVQDLAGFSKVEDSVDQLSSLQILWRGDLTHSRELQSRERNV